MADRVRLPRLLQKALQSDGNTLKEKARLHPLSLSVELNLYPLSRATMTLPETDAAVQMHDLVEIFGQNGSFGIFRVVNIATTYKRQRQVQLNHALDVFSDALLPGEMTATGTVAQVLAQFVAGQTANIGGSPYWALGTCEDTNAYSADIKYTNLMQCLTNLAKAEEDYYFTFDFSRFPWRLNFIARNDTVLSEFRLPRNVESCQVSFDNSDMCTRLYLSVDTTMTSQDGSTTVTTHETHNDTAAQALYGIVSKTAGIKAEQVPDKAAWVQRYFARHAQPGVQISISGREINRLSGETLDEMHLGRICRVALPEYSTTFNERIIAVKYPDVLRDPERVDVSLANKKQSAEGSFAGLTSRTSATESASKETQKELQNTKTSTTTKWRVTDQHVTDQGTILHEAGLEIDAHGVWLFAKEQGALGTMQAGLNVAADNITAEVTRATEQEGVLSSQISQTADAIRLKVSKGDVATQLSVECGNVTISGGDLVVSGYITSQGLITSMGQFDGSIYASGSIGTPSSMAAKSITLDGESLTSKVLSFIGNLYTVAADSDINLAHYHDISASESNGVITITQGAAQSTAGTATFNIADTQFYRDAVASAETNGWNAARAKVVPPSAGTGTSFTVDVPSATQGETQTYTFTIQKGATPGTSGYASVALGQSVVGRIAIGDWYSAGWDAARGYVSAPSAGTSASMSVGIPASTVNQGSSYNFTVSVDNNYAYIKNAVNTTVARVSNSAYNAGWAAAAAKFRRVGNYVYGPSSTVGGESSYHASIGGSHDYSASSFVHGGTTENSSWSGVINGVSVTYTKSSHSSALAIVWS